MKIFRYAAVAATALMALMNLGVALGGSDEDPSAAAISGAAALTLLGVVAAYGLVRALPWGWVAGVVVGALNVVGSVIAVVNDWEGAVIGIVVAAVGTALSLAGGEGVLSRRAVPSV